MDNKVVRKGEKMELDQSERGRQGFLFAANKTKIENPSARIRAISQYFEHLSVSLFGGRLNLAQNDTRGDIFHEEWGMTIEVKASDNTHPFRVYEEQLNRHLVEDFPYGCIYFLWGYKNDARKRIRGENGTQKLYQPSPISKIWSTNVLFGYLSANTQMLNVVDIAVLDAIRNKNGTILVPRDREMCPIIKVNKTLFRKLGTPEGLRILESPDGSPTAFQHWIETSFCGAPVGFSATFIVSEEIKEKILKLPVMRKSGGPT